VARRPPNDQLPRGGWAWRSLPPDTARDKLTMEGEGAGERIGVRLLAPSNHGIATDHEVWAIDRARQRLGCAHDRRCRTSSPRRRIRPTIHSFCRIRLPRQGRDRTLQVQGSAARGTTRSLWDRSRNGELVIARETDGYRTARVFGLRPGVDIARKADGDSATRLKGRVTDRAIRHLREGDRPLPGSVRNPAGVWRRRCSTWRFCLGGHRRSGMALTAPARS
jgi:hypothetical protein